jgi:hypothetical protein
MGSLIWKGEVEKMPEAMTLNLKNINQIPSMTFSWQKEELMKGNFNL